MDNFYVIRGRLQEIYAEKSKIVNKVLQFVLALITFAVINQNIGYMKAAASPVATLALAVVCTCLPLTVTVVLATVLILVHMYSVSIGVLAVTAVIFLIMYIFYLRLTPKMAILVLLTPLAFALKIPYVIPIAAALVTGPVSLVAIACGTIVFYMMEYVKKVALSIDGGGSKAILAQSTAYAKHVFTNKEMWVVIFAFIVCFFLVYTLRRQSMDQAWKIAIIVGAIANIIVVAVGSMSMGLHISYLSLMIGSLFAVIVGLVLEFFFFSVDYARSENLQFEDDEYYYYVKAIPKVSVSTPEKTVKRINERQETEIMNPDEVRKMAKKSAENRNRSVSNNGVRISQANPGKKRPPKKGPVTKKHDMKEVDKMLLTQSLKRDLNLKD
ncbi:MAG: hypothetical protein MR224_04340 [Dorea sp.]|nr:hypothetical protein [Dorea sp.]MDY2812427.1 hypothetical protein [Dorea sp.]